MFNPAYGLLMIAGLVLSAVLWPRVRPARGVPALVFIGGLIGAVLGAKLGYLLVEFPLVVGEPRWWLHALVGRTILGGLLGGYLGVEWGKRLCSYDRPTGDGFALVVPGALALGRIGCWVSGCCAGRACTAAWYTVVDAHGVHRYPAQLVEAGFSVLMLGAMWALYAAGRLRGQLFHLYLIAYGAFRLLHEFWRESPRLLGPLTSYQVLAAVVLAFGVERFVRRRAELRAQVLLLAPPATASAGTIGDSGATTR